MEEIELATIETKKCKYYLAIANLYADKKQNYDEAELYYLKCLQINEEYKGANSDYSWMLYKIFCDIEKALKYLKK